MASLKLKKEMTESEFNTYKKENIDGNGFKMSKNPAGDMFFNKEDGSGTIFVYKWVGGYLVQAAL